MIFVMVVVLFSHSVESESFETHGLHPASLLCPWSFPGKNTRVGCHFLCQGIFLTQGLSLRLLHWEAGSLLLWHQESPVLWQPKLFNTYRIWY